MEELSLQVSMEPEGTHDWKPTSPQSLEQLLIDVS